MHTVMVMTGGLVLLAILTIVARKLSKPAFAGKTVLAFLPIWFVLAGVNMAVGVLQAGYSVAEEAPIFLVVFGGPAAIAIFVWWKFFRG